MSDNRGKKYCCVFGCLNDSSIPELSLFRLPIEQERRLQWLRLIDREDLINKSQTRHVVCEAHFYTEDIMKNSVRKLLKKNCLPSLNLPDPKKVNKHTQVEITSYYNSSQAETTSASGSNEIDSTIGTSSCQTDINTTDNLTQTTAGLSALSDTDDDTSYGAKIPAQSCKERDQIEDLIAKVHDYFTEEYELLKQMKPAEILSHLSKISWRTARATGVSQAAVREILSKQATRTRTKRQRSPQRPDERHQPPKNPRTARYKPKKAESSSEEDSCGGDEDDGEHSTTEQVETLVVKEEPETYNSSEEDSCGGDEDDGEHSTTEHVVETLMVKEEPEAYNDEPEVYVQLAGVKTEPDACGDDSSSEEDSCGGDEDDGEHSTTEHVVETLMVKEEPEAYNDEPEVYVQLAGVKTEPDACGDDSVEPEVYRRRAGVKTEPDACGDDSSDCETLAALSAAKRHKGSIKQRHAEAPPASSAPPSRQLPLPPDQQLKVDNPLTNQQGFS